MSSFVPQVGQPVFSPLPVPAPRTKNYYMTAIAGTLNEGKTALVDVLWAEKLPKCQRSQSVCSEPQVVFFMGLFRSDLDSDNEISHKSSCISAKFSARRPYLTF